MTRNTIERRIEAAALPGLDTIPGMGEAVESLVLWQDLGEADGDYEREALQTFLEGSGIEQPAGRYRVIERRGSYITVDEFDVTESRALKVERVPDPPVPEPAAPALRAVE